MPTKREKEAKKALDIIIQKSRVHLYKPIQIAEILFHHRTERGWDLDDLESYRNISKRWRDEISLLLVGRKSTSSQKYQDNIFDMNAVPPKLLAQLGTINKKDGGCVEAYIYKSLKLRLSSVNTIHNYISKTTAEKFSLSDLMKLFKADQGLRRSVDKMYEILVYALFSTIVRALKVQITLEIKNKDKEVLEDFAEFIRIVLGINKKQTKCSLPADLYRVGVTNAADKGLDMWANFGPAIQVKHLTLTPELTEDITEEIVASKIIIVCLDAEKTTIETLLQQVGWGEKIQGIITANDLDDWYITCLSKKYKKNIGKDLLTDVRREFETEFPLIKEINPFVRKRGYSKIIAPKEWKI